MRWGFCACKSTLRARVGEMLFTASRLTLEAVRECLFRDVKIEVAPEDYTRLEASYVFLESFATDRVIYGINTGFGPMAQWRVSDDHLKELQYNIIRSHATGAGEPLEDLPPCWRGWGLFYRGNREFILS